MISINVGNPQVNYAGSYYPPRRQPSYPPPREKTLVRYYPMVRGKPPTRNYLGYGQIHQADLGQPIVSQPIVSTLYPRMNTIWNPSYNQ